MARDLLFGLALIIAVVGYMAFQNHKVASAEEAASRASATAARLQAELDESQLKERIVTVYVDRVRVVRERGATITKEVPVYVTTKADAACTVPVGFVRVHDAAAQNLPIGEPTGDPDAPATGVTLSGVATAVAGNYTTCHEIRQQLIQLQEYVGGLQAIARP